MERVALDRWASPWLKNQHVARYEWAKRFVGAARVLDAACGTAYGTRMLREAGAAQVDGVDYSREAFARARNGPASLGLAVADVTRLPLVAGTYDVVVSFETIEHVPDREFLSEVTHVLKSGGCFLCSTPNRELLSPGLTLRDRPANPYHLREYDREDFEALLRDFFPSFAMYGQTRFSREHAALLRRVGARSPGAALRLHQLRNVIGLPWEGPGRHVPSPLPWDGVPEVLLAFCAT